MKINQSIFGSTVSMKQGCKHFLPCPHTGSIVPSYTHAENIKSHQLVPTGNKNVAVSGIFPANLRHPFIQIIVHRKW
jgi:hypothetical protein